MFIRKTRILNRETKKYYFNFQLVESVRTDRGPRQRILLNLGAGLDLDPQECKILANRIESIIAGSQELFLPSEKIEKLAQTYAKKLIKHLSQPVEQTSRTDSLAEIYRVDINTLEHKEARTIGAESLLLNIANALKLPELFRSMNLSRTEIALSLATIIARAIFPASERATFSWLRNQSGLGELLEFDFHDISLQKLYDVSDLLLRHKDCIERHLEKEQRALHGIRSTMILYDLTNTYIEGQAKKNPKARYGVSKEKRADSPLITLGLVVDEHGFPLRSKFFDGNIGEAKTLEKMIQDLGYSDELLKPILVLDAGIVSEENLAWLQSNGFLYIVCARSRPPTDEVEGDHRFVGKNNRVSVANIKIEENGDRWVSCYSLDKAATANQMKTLFQQRFEYDLCKLRDGLKKSRTIKKYKKIVERLGRVKEKHKRISGCYAVDVVASPDGKIATDIQWHILEATLSEKLSGKYFLRTNVTDKNAEELWNTYNTIRTIEDAFRFMKSSLGLRPIYHQKENRVDGHLWITILAYHLIQDITYRLKQNEIRDNWESIRISMASRVRVTTQIQTDDNKILYIRTTTSPEPHHKKIYTALHISPKILSKQKTLL